MFLRNLWYVAAFSSELPAGAVLGRRIVGDPVVLFRTASGAVGAVEDRCGHRGMALSHGGECDGQILRCPYHGMEFDRAGACVRIPGQDHVPAGAGIRSYPVIERDALLWIWPGDPAKSDVSSIPSHPYHTDPDWVWSSFHVEMHANWQLIIDNLLDLSHIGYVHRLTIGGNPDAHSNAETKVTRDGDQVHLRRWILNCEPSPTFRAYGIFAGKIDRWQEVDFRPGFLELYTGATDAGTGAYEGHRQGGVHIRHMHGITPETEDRTRYFFTQARNFQIGDQALTTKLHQLAELTFQEDKDVLDAQYQRLAEDPARELLNIRSDAAGVHARRILADLYQQEQRAPAVGVTN